MERGLWLGLGAYLLWGLSPVFWNLVAGVSAVEVLAHRVVWAVPIMLLLVAAQRGWRELRETYAVRRTVLLAVAGGVLIVTNWGVYLWAVLNERILEASLGYFINPLVSVALGVIVLREHMRPAQRTAVAIAGGGVLAMTVMLGALPWVSLLLAGSFGLYGLLKKLEGSAPALLGLLGEVTLLAIPGLAYVLVLTASGDGNFARSLPAAGWFVATGFATVVPLWMFGAGVKRIPLSTMGLLQYVAPTLQLVVGVLIYGEDLVAAQVVGFVIVWLALAVFARDQFVATRRFGVAAA